MRLRPSLIALLVALLAPAGCIASKRPPPLDDAESVRLEHARFPKLVIGVIEPELDVGDAQGATSFERSGSAMRSDLLFNREVESAVRLIEELRATGYFRQVDFSRQLASKPDLLARANFENARRGVVAGGGIFTVLSLGLIPSWVTNHWQRSFSLETEDGSGQIHVDAEYSQVVMLSWGTILLLPFHDWTYGWSVVPEDYDDALRLTLLERQARIEALVAAGTAP